MCKKNIFYIYMTIAMISVATLFAFGIKPTRVHAQGAARETVPCQPIIVSVAEKPAVASVTESTQGTNWISAMEFITPVLLTSLALIIYLVHRRHQNKINKKKL
jgi:hypothetical protein